MNYENQTCPYCGNPLREGEDVVVCPVCATPQHRECWMQNGHCANDERHASGFVWEREENKAQETEENNKVCPACGSENPRDSLHCGNCGMLFGGNEGNASQPKQCAFCGRNNDSDALHCKYCGAPFSNQNAFFAGSPYMAGTGMAADEKIGENNAGDIAIYVQASSRRYLPKFKRFESGKKLSFNFAAFLFAPYWFFYRKLYKAGVFFLVLFVTSSMLLSGFQEQILTASDAYINAINAFDIENATDEELAAMEKEAMRLNSEFFNKVKKPTLIIAAVSTVLRLICALTADIFYYKKIVADMKLINDSVREENLRKMMMAKRGGLSALAFTASLLGESMLISILIYAADLLKNSF